MANEHAPGHGAGTGSADLLGGALSRGMSQTQIDKFFPKLSKEAKKRRAAMKKKRAAKAKANKKKAKKNKAKR
ncbi:hypothetical protein LCGC14_1302440 [marine sediment metagenome]|uniref:Uncharacterized protein n=1 Tax=marine sediment metagenome TaxID=412755 RepID=A0A0F9NS48_9ZZZZ